MAEQKGHIQLNIQLVDENKMKSSSFNPFSREDPSIVSILVEGKYGQTLDLDFDLMLGYTFGGQPGESGYQAGFNRPGAPATDMER